MAAPMLETKNLGISFGGLKAVDELTMTINKGQLYGLIGPNGAGKTTAFNLLTGFLTRQTKPVCRQRMLPACRWMNC